MNHGAVNSSNVVATLLDDGGLTDVTIDVNGDVIVPAGSTPGTYVLTYQICDAANPDDTTMCDTATITIVLTDEADSTPPVSGGTNADDTGSLAATGSNMLMVATLAVASILVGFATLRRFQKQ